MRPERKIYKSTICIDGKRISEMREIANAIFEGAFMSIEVSDGRFLVRIDDSVGNGIDIDKLERFKNKYRLCNVKVYREVDLFSMDKK